MKKNYFIYAYEELFQGQYGLYDAINFFGNFKEALEAAIDMSYDIILSHPYIKEKITDIYDDMAYEIWEVEDSAPSYRGSRVSPQEYIKRFCKK